MRISRTLLTIAALLAFSACGDDDEDPSLSNPSSSLTDVQFEPDVDSGVGDTGNGGTGGVGTTGAGTGDGSGTGSGTGGATGDGTTDGGVVIESDPEVLALTTVFGPIEGGTETIVLTVGYATDFRVTAPEVSFGGSPANSVEAISRGVVKVVTPPNAPGGADVTVEVDGETASLPAGFTYEEGKPLSYVEVSVDGVVETDGVPVHLPVQVVIHGDAKPAALLIDLKIDLAQLPLAQPTALVGTVAEAAEKVLTVNKKNDGVRLLVLGKNRKLIGDGTVVTLIYNLPPTDPWSLTPLIVTGKAVDAFGEPVEVAAKSGWLGLNEGSD